MFGSGMAVMPILKKEFIEKRKWITDQELLDIISICKCMPGANTVNIVSFIGNKRCKFYGGLTAALGIIIVPIISIVLFTMFYENISKIEAVKHAIAGVNVCVCALIINFLIDFWKKAIISKTTFFTFIISFIVYVFIDISIIALIAIMGFISFTLEKVLESGKNEI